MHPWITGRIVETMHHEARARAAQDRTHRELRDRTRETEPTRERFGLLVARAGLRIAGCEPSPELYVQTGC